jgi:hypothetical protein
LSRRNTPSPSALHACQQGKRHEHLPSSPRKNRKLALILGGMTILGMLALIGLVLLSNFPGPTQGSADKSEAPPEDVSKAKP